jgi:hypothetical protein
VALIRRRSRPARRASADPLTLLLGATAVVGTAGVIGGEILRVWDRGDAPSPAEADDVLAAAGVATRQTVEVAVAGLRRASLRENAMLSLLLSFNTTWPLVRYTTYRLRGGGTFGPFRDAKFGRTHVHHFVPGIVLLLVSGAASIISRDERHDPFLAVPFGIGAALTLDEWALLLRLDDVYWTEEGILSVQVSLAAASAVSAIALARRVLRRGEQTVLEPVGGSD